MKRIAATVIAGLALAIEPIAAQDTARNEAFIRKRRKASGGGCDRQLHHDDTVAPRLVHVLRTTSSIATLFLTIAISRQRIGIEDMRMKIGNWLSATAFSIVGWRVLA